MSLTKYLTNIINSNLYFLVLFEFASFIHKALSYHNILMATNHQRARNDDSFEFIPESEKNASILSNENLLDDSVSASSTSAANLSNDLSVQNEFSAEDKSILKQRIVELENEIEKFRAQNCALHERIGMISGEKTIISNEKASLADELKETNRENRALNEKIHALFQELIAKEKEEKVITS